MKDKDCIFCKIVKGEIKIDLVYENDNFIAFPDTNPCTKGHTLIIPKKHYVNIMDIPISLGVELVDAIKNVAGNLIKGDVTGFNILQNNFADAGQLVMHAHFHIIPRRKGDNLRTLV